MSTDINKILSERQGTHGPYREHARITQSLKDIMQGEQAFGRLSVCQRETLDMIAHKIGRVLAGNPNVQDHWDDIAGYAKLVSKDIVEVEVQDKITQSWADAANEDKSKRNPLRPTCGALCPTPTLCTDIGECRGAAPSEAH